MKNYLQTIRLAFSRELVRHLAARLGERENAVGKALEGMVPMVLCQLVIEAGAGKGHALLTPILRADWPGGKGVQNLTEVLGLLGSGPSTSGALAAGEGLLHRLFGANRPALDNSMSTYAGLRPDSAVVLLRLVAAVWAVGLAQYALQQQLTALRLSEEVGAAKNQIYAWLPPDLPRWPGFRQRTALTVPHAVWAAELARPYWVLVLAAAGAVVLALLVAGAVDGPASRQGPVRGLLAGGPDSARPAGPGNGDSARVCLAQLALPKPAAW